MLDLSLENEHLNHLIHTRPFYCVFLFDSCMKLIDQILRTILLVRALILTYFFFFLINSQHNKLGLNLGPDNETLVPYI